MKHNYNLILVTFLWLSFPVALQAQEWQWGKRGGSTDEIPASSLDNEEHVQAMTTDENGNVYLLSPIGIANADVDGHQKNTYSEYGGGGGANIDYVIASFDCSGNYRWSKVIGGSGSDVLLGLETDGLGHIYTTGRVIRNSPGFPVHFGSEGVANDTILPYGSGNQNKASLFVVQYTTEGVMNWLRMPQAADVSEIDATNGQTSVHLSVDASGNVFWICYIQPGTYVQGAFVNTTPGRSLYMFKYDVNGNFSGAVPIDMQLGGSAVNHLKMVRNPANGNLYVAGYKSLLSDDTVIMGGQNVSNHLYIAAFNASGNYLWKKENTLTASYSLDMDITLDTSGTVYITGATVSGDGFNGQVFTSANNQPFPFVLSMNSNGNTLWQTNASTNNSVFGDGITVHGNEVFITGGNAGNLNWSGSQLTVPTNSGYKVFTARFNRQTGGLNALAMLNGSFGFSDFGTATTADTAGNYYVGGKFGSQLQIAGQTVLNTGQQTDFFIAKYGTATCEVLSVGSTALKTLKVYPNPTNGALTIVQDIPQVLHYKLYTVLGTIVAKGEVNEIQSQVDLSAAVTGIYTLQLTDNKGAEQWIKVVKR